MDNKSQDIQSPKPLDSINWKDLEVLEFPRWYEDEKEDKFEGFWKRIIGKRTRYEDYLISQLRATYMDLEGDIRTLIPEYAGVTSDEERRNLNEIGKYIVNLLKSAKGILENQKLTKRRMLIASSLLYEVEECLIWITPPTLALAQLTSLRSRVANLTTSDKDEYVKMLDECEKILKENKENFEVMGRPKTEDYRAHLEEVIRFVNTETLNEKINTGLQIERLRTLRYWGMALLSLVVLVFPNISNPEEWAKFPTNILGQQTLIALFTAISIGIIGGIGGFLSGLLQVRGSKTNLGDYEMSILLFELRPILGAFAALILVALMSWGILSDVITTEKLGSYVLVAFVSGFSERYFINLLKLDSMEKNPDIADESSQEKVGTSNSGRMSL